MGKVGIKLNLPAINELMKGEGIQSVLRDAGASVAGDAGSDYASSINMGRWLAFCNVYPDSKAAANDNYKNNSLLKALSSSGLKMTKGA